MIIRCLRGKKLLNHVQNGYLTPLGRPIDNMALLSISQFNIEVMRWSSVDFSHPALLSIFIGSATLRLMMELTGLALKDLRFESGNERTLPKIIKNVFVVDLQRDIKFFNIHHVEANTLRCYYSPKEVIKYCLNSYYLLTIARALNSLLNDERYAQWMLSGSDIVSHDPTFITPMAVMLINYILLHKSTHPFLIHLRGRKMVCANLAFMSGLLFVPLPLVLLNITQFYTASYSGVVIMHIVLRVIKKGLAVLREKKIHYRYS